MEKNNKPVYSGNTILFLYYGYYRGIRVYKSVIYQAGGGNIRIKRRSVMSCMVHGVFRYNLYNNKKVRV